jgi:hypothetical protein
MEAAWRRRPDVIGFLIENGADVNAGDKHGYTVLYHAGEWNNLEIAKLLIENGADMNVENDGGYTPLMIAAGSGSSSLLARYVTDTTSHIKIYGTLHVRNKNLTGFAVGGYSARKDIGSRIYDDSDVEKSRNGDESSLNN